MNSKENMDYMSSFVELDDTTPEELIRLCSVPISQQQQPHIFSQAEANNADDLTNKANYILPQEAIIDSKHTKKKKKITHRDIERQRRQDMATLYGSLRTLLPFDYLKGKRSISDHIQEAVNYIKHLEEKIQELNDKRDELRKLSNNNSSSPSSSDVNLENNDQKDALTVKPCLVGVEVVIDTSLRKSFPLSRVLQVLIIEEGLSIVSCSSTKVKERMLHTIKSQVSDEKYIDVSALEKKLTNSIIRPVNLSFR